MEPLVMHFVSALTSAGDSSAEPQKVYIIVPRARAYLADLLAKALEGRKNVEVLVDRRQRERRTQQQLVAVERRRADRRRRKDELIEVVIGTGTQLEGSPEGSS